MNDGKRGAVSSLHLIAVLLAVGAALLVARWGFAKTSGGGTDPTTDCFAEFDGVSSNPVVCTDGDSSCDSDSVAGQCSFHLAICLNQTDLPGCTPTALKKVKVKPKKGSPVAPDLATSTCGAFTDVVVKLKGKKKNKPRTKKIKVLALSSTKPRQKDKNTLTLTCNPAPACATPPCTTGHGPRCPANVSPDQPNAIVLSVLNQGTDLDNGWKGPSFNFPTPANTTLQLCLSNCNLTTDPDCDTTVNSGPTTFNKTTFGPPLPLIAAHVPVCVVNEYQQPTFTGKANIRDGSIDGEIDLFAHVYLSDEEHVCPKCNSGKCDIGPNAGKSCAVDGTVTVTLSTAANKTFNLSKDCPPDPSNPAGTLNIKLPLTTGTSTLAPLTGGSAATPCVQQSGEPRGLTPSPDACGAGASCVVGGCSGPDSCQSMIPDPVSGNPVCIDQKGGISQACCSDKPDTPCHPTRGGGTSIARTGKPAPFKDTGGMGWGAGDYPKSADSVTVATFCEPATGTSSVDGLTGLPGPGALILPSHGVLSRAQDANQQ
jgi:hypothetical protein